MKSEEKKTFREICDEKCRAKTEFIQLLHHATEVNLATVYRWVSGFSVPAPRDRKKIAEALGSTVEDLFGV